MLDILQVKVLYLLNSYGYIVFTLYVALGVIIMPIPEETALIAVGVLISQGKLSFIPMAVSGILGTFLGITTGYLVGKFAWVYIRTTCLGKWFHVDEKYEKVSVLFQRFGKWLLFFGYYIPFVRHFVGLFAGSFGINYKYFAFFAYLGAIFWVLFFISLGVALDRGILQVLLRII